MKSKYLQFLQIKVILLLFVSQFSFGQLSNFALSVTKTDETCTANGTATFSVSNTTAGATIVYQIYHLPNVTTPIAVLSTNSYTTLVAGNYSVIATQSLGSLSNTQQQNFTIINQIVQLSYQLIGDNVVCGNDGKITVNTTGGTAVSYEIFVGPVIKPLQSSNVFTGLVAGLYQVRVFDTCGEGVVQTYTLFASTPGLTVGASSTSNFVDCSTTTVTLSITHSSSTIIAYPLTVQYIVNPPTGAPIIYNQTINSGAADNLTFNQNITLFANQSYSYSVLVTDKCGNVYTSNGNGVNSTITPQISHSNQGCGLNTLYILPIQSVTITAAPALYTGVVPQNMTSLIESNHLILSNVPVGHYTFVVTDICGVVYTLQHDVESAPVIPLSATVYEGCEIGFGSVYISALNGNLQTVTLLSAPASYPNSLPQNVSSNINYNHAFFSMAGFPMGTYVFNVIDVCGNSQNVTAIVSGYHETTNANIIEHCGSFDLNLNHTSNNLGTSTYWLQKFNPITNQWEHPLTGVAFVAGLNPNISNSIQLNIGINYNLAFTGTFRVIKGFPIFGNGDINSCNNIIYQFTFSGQPKINNVYSFSCNNSTYDAIVDATGLAPLIYRITTKNGISFVIQNGNSSIFLGLQSAIYNFQVEDACGNIVNSQFSVPIPFVFAITPTTFCNGQSASLTVPNFTFLQYEWWKDNNTSTILSTSNSLQFASFNAATGGGTYHVRVKYIGNPASCINFVLDYQVSTSSNFPNAGLGSIQTYCGNQGVFDLFALISGTYDTNGTWQEITNSGTLNNNFWNSTNVAFGNYQFKYKVNGSCGTSAESLVNIQIKQIPQVPVASVNPVVCDAQSINLSASNVPNVTYLWNGPNGFSSTLQNPTINAVSVINSGIYFVKTISNGCDSGFASVTVSVNPLPQFSLESSCVENRFTVLGSPISNSFIANAVTYNWSGPNGFTSSENPIDLTNKEKGIYNLTITNAEGCSSSKSIEIINTLCSIPKGISPNGDGSNEVFDLSGLGEILKFKIFNRYGMVVFEQDGYTNQWHGQDYNNRELPDATYYYYIKLGTGEAKTGWVYVTK